MDDDDGVTRAMLNELITRSKGMEDLLKLILVRLNAATAKLDDYIRASVPPDPDGPS